MNKLFTKIAALSVGLAMAVGVGVAIRNGNSVKRVSAATGSVDVNFSTTDQCVTASDSSLVYENTSGGVTATFSATKASASTNTNNYYPGTSGKSYTSTRFYKNSTLNVAVTSNYYITSIEFTCTGSYASTLASSSWDQGVGSYNGTKVTITCNANVDSITCTLGGTAGITDAKVYWTDQYISSTISANPDSFELATGDSFDVSIDYNSLSSDITVSSSSACISVPSSLTASGTGSTTLTVQGVSVGNATITLTSGVATKTINVAVYEVETFNKITSSGELIGNQTIVIVKNPGTEDGTTPALDITGGSNNRNVTSVEISGSSVSTASATLAKVLLEKNGSYFRLKDISSNKYYQGWSGQNYLRVSNLDASSDLFNWSITITNTGAANIKCVESERYIKHNATNTCFGTYASGQEDVAIYMIPSDIPVYTPITSISAENGTVEAGSTLSYSASYLPVDATESIEVEFSDSALSCSNLVVSNGSVSFTLSASSSITVESTFTVTLKASDHSESVYSTGTITVTVYQPTHNRIDSNDGLFNGAKVIFGNSSSKIASGAQNTSGNNIVAVSLNFAETGASLSNASGSAKEFVMWQVTVGDYTGWAFYSEGTYLVNVDGTNNYLKRSAKLTENAVFSVAITSGVAQIVSVKNAESETNPNTMFFNIKSNILSCYKSSCEIGDTYASVSLYLASAKSDSVVAQGFENFFMHMDSTSESDKGTGLCLESKNNYYGFAKTAYNGLTLGEKGELSSESLDRLAAWASANGETFDASEGTFTANRLNVEFSTEDNNMTIIIVVIAATSAIALSVLLLLKKRKQK